MGNSQSDPTKVTSLISISALRKEKCTVTIFGEHHARNANNWKNYFDGQLIRPAKNMVMLLESPELNTDYDLAPSNRSGLETNIPENSSCEFYGVDLIRRESILFNKIFGHKPSDHDQAVLDFYKHFQISIKHLNNILCDNKNEIKEYLDSLNVFDISSDEIKEETRIINHIYNIRKNAPIFDHYQTQRNDYEKNLQEMILNIQEIIHLDKEISEQPIYTLEEQTKDIQTNTTLYLEKMQKYSAVQQLINKKSQLNFNVFILSGKLTTPNITYSTDIIILSYLLNKINQGKTNFIIAVGDNHAVDLKKVLLVLGWNSIYDKILDRNTIDMDKPKNIIFDLSGFINDVDKIFIDVQGEPKKNIFGGASESFLIWIIVLFLILIIYFISRYIQCRTTH